MRYKHHFYLFTWNKKRKVLLLSLSAHSLHCWWWPLVWRLTNWVLSHQTTAACTTFSYSCIYKAYYQPILGKLSFCPFRIYQIDLNFMKNIKSMFWLSLLLLVVFPRNKIIICSITDLSFESPDQQTNGILRPLNMYMFPLQEIELR